MGAPKLLLLWQGRPIIDRVLEAWTASRVTRTVVVLRAGDEPLREACRRFDVDVVETPAATPDMKASVALAIDHIQAAYSPQNTDAWLLAPADLPGLRADVIDRVIAAYDGRGRYGVVAAFGPRRGHPVLLPWGAANAVAGLAPHEGINALVHCTVMSPCPCADPSVVDDVDTPADYARLQPEHEPQHNPPIVPAPAGSR